MKNNRRIFLKLSGLTGLGIATGSLLKSCASGTNQDKNTGLDQVIIDLKKTHEQRFNMSGYAAPVLDKVRVGIIGLGQRGPAHLKNLVQVEGVEIKALCDLRPEKNQEALKMIEGTGNNPVLYSGNADEWKKLCERDDIDLIVVTTPWYMHTEMSVYAMEHGKHVVSEVPAAGTIEECWQLVETSERTKKHLMMMENDSYLPFQMLTLNMARDGFFGDIVHGDCAYNTSKMKNNFSRSMYWDMWWLKLYASRKGNIYPTHGLGPVCQIMDINRGDKLEYLVSVESNDFMMEKKSKELAETDSYFKQFIGKDFRGTMNTTTIRTTKGRTIMLQHDASTPSPHNLFHGIYGTKGAALYDPQPPRIANGNHEWISPEEFIKIKEKYTPNIFKKMGEAAKNSGHGGSDLLLSWHIIDCLRNGLPMDQDVYDAAVWSSILPLSEWSVKNRSNSIDIPDFTAGAWKTNLRNMDIELKNGGNTKVI